MSNTDDLAEVRKEIKELALDIYEFGKMHGEMGYIVSQGYFIRKTKRFLNIKVRGKSIGDIVKEWIERP